jgi:hypothetical protein
MSSLDALRAGGYEFTPEWSIDDVIFMPQAAWTWPMVTMQGRAILMF